ncbi:VWA domain-containing protein [Salinisphaera sp. T31B1]|uniref:VWA domain-containing protein n=1 Tax=Salinisphaera sp. T31B1 TaxID=727963 RepID=UPI003342B72B
MADVRVSTAETLDAFRVAELVGWHDRQQLKEALGATLAKSEAESRAFDGCFERFFRFEDFTATPAIADDELPGTDERFETKTGTNTPPAAANDSGDAMAGDQANGHGQAQGGSSGGNARRHGGQASDTLAEDRSDPTGAGEPAPLMSQPSSSLGRLLVADDPVALSMAIAGAAREVALEDIQLFTQHGLYTLRLMDRLGRPELMDEITMRAASAEPADRRLAAELDRRRERLRRQIREHVEAQYALHADTRGRRLRERRLRSTRLSSVQRHDDAIMRRMIERMARQLIAAHSRRRRVTQRGRLNLPQMLRRNMRHDGHMIELAWKSRRVERPRVFVICDISGSVAHYARFMLMFLYSLGEVLSQVRAFVFCSRLAEVTDLFRQYDLDEAVRRTLHDHGQGSTDYAQALADFNAMALNDIDRHSTVLILGDARNNGGNPRTDLLRRIYERSQRLIWLNPEPRTAWDSGDSEMGRYRAHCHQVARCGSLIDLERVVSELLRNVA